MYTYIINLIYNIFLNYITISYCAFGIQMSTPREKTKIIVIALFKIKKNNLYFLVLYTYLVISLKFKIYNLLFILHIHIFKILEEGFTKNLFSKLLLYHF